MSVWWRGVQLDPRTAAMMDETVRLCPGLPINPTQGSWSGAQASAGTHSGTSAVDLDGRGLTAGQRDQVVRAMRKVGFAAWDRTGKADWMPHIHAIANAHPYNSRGASSSAADQLRDYENGRDGLAGHGPDYHDRTFAGVLWEDYTSGTTGGDDDMRMITADGRGTALYGPGYFHKLTAEEAGVLRGQGIPEKEGNAREFDVVRAAAVQGEHAGDPSANG